MSIIYQSVVDFLEWIDNHGDSRVKNLWMMDSPLPVVMIIAFYLYFVLKAGPEYMKFRNPMKIDNFVMIYDVIQVFFSLYLVKEAFRLIWLPGGNKFNCIEIDYSDTDIAKEKVFIVWFYFFSKLLDLFDTIFFVLRKKQNQLTFLHIYHHTIILALSWIITKYYPGGEFALFGTINSFVHIVMYSYYFLTIFKTEYKKAWWKKYLTQLQLIQFVITGVHCCITLMATDCNFPKLIIALLLPQDILMFYLFWDFYKKAYCHSKNK